MTRGSDMPGASRGPSAVLLPGGGSGARKKTLKKDQKTLPVSRRKRQLKAQDRTQDGRSPQMQERHNDPLVQYLTTKKHEDFKALMQKAGGRMYDTANQLLQRHDLAENVVQEVFLLVLRGKFRLGTFRSGVGVMCSKVLSCARETLRSDRRQKECEREAFRRGRSESPGVSVDRRIDTAAAVGKLPEELKACVVLLYYAAMNVSEISRDLRLSRPTVHTRIAAARGLLGKRLSSALAATLLAVTGSEASAALPAGQMPAELAARLKGLYASEAARTSSGAASGARTFQAASGARKGARRLVGRRARAGGLSAANLATAAILAILLGGGVMWTAVRLRGGGEKPRAASGVPALSADVAARGSGDGKARAPGGGDSAPAAFDPRGAAPSGNEGGSGAAGAAALAASEDADDEVVAEEEDTKAAVEIRVVDSEGQLLEEGSVQVKLADGMDLLGVLSFQGGAEEDAFVRSIASHSLADGNPWLIEGFSEKTLGVGFSVEAAADGRDIQRPLTFEPEADSTKQVELALRKITKMRIVVKDAATGLPIEGAEISYSPKVRSIERARLKAGRHVASDGVIVEIDARVAESRGAYTKINGELMQSERGTVTGQEWTETLPAEPDIDPEDVTGPDGSLRIPGLAGSPCSFEVFAEGYKPLSFSKVRFRPEIDALMQQSKLKGRGTITLTVLDLQGRPWPEVEVDVHYDGYVGRTTRMPTDSQGICRLVNVPAGVYHFNLPAFFCDAVEEETGVLGVWGIYFAGIELTHGQQETLTLAPKNLTVRDASVTVVVRDSAGAPLEGIDVSISRDPMDHDRATTDASGEAAIGAVPSGTYAVEFGRPTNPRPHRRWMQRRLFEAPPGEPTTITVTLGRGVIRGRFVYAKEISSGRHAIVLARSKERSRLVAVSEDGKFELKGALPGKYTFKRMGGLPLMRPTEVTLTSETEPVEIEIPAAIPAHIGVHVTVPRGKLVRDVVLHAVGPDGGKIRFELSELSPQEGKFFASRLWPGRYRVRADLPGYNGQEKTLELEEGQEAELEFTFEG